MFFKFIIITGLLIFVFGKIFKYAFKYLIMNAVQKQQANYTSDKKYKKEGSIHVDTDPRDSKKNKKFGGGEYIDYEIIK